MSTSRRYWSWWHHQAQLAEVVNGPPFPPPIMVDVDPFSGACNLDCAWCCQAASRAVGPPKAMAVETMDRLGDFCAGWGVRAWRISGNSEPLMNKGLAVLIDSGYRNGIDMGLITNGLRLDRLKPETAVKLAWVGVSLDATFPFAWAAVKGGKPVQFSRILDHVRALRAACPALDISLKFLQWNSETSLSREDFIRDGLPQVRPSMLDGTNGVDAEDAHTLAADLGVRAIVKQAYPKNMAESYRFEKCRATPLGGVFDPYHKFHICCDARDVGVLTRDYTRNDWTDLPPRWGGSRHMKLLAAIKPANCPGCAKHELNELLEQLDRGFPPEEQINFL